MLMLVVVTLGGKVSAQWSIVPQFSLGVQTLHFPKNNSYNITSGGGITLGLDFQPRYKLSDNFFINSGIGLRYVLDSDTSTAGSISYAPLFIGVRWGEELYIEGNVGYNLPLNSSGLGYVTGWFARIGVGLGSDNISLGASLDLLHIFGVKTLSYVPAGYLPVENGTGVSVYLEYGIPLKK